MPNKSHRSAADARYRQGGFLPSGEPLDAAYAYAAEVMTTNMLAADATEGIDAFLEKRDPNWRGC